MKSFLNNKVYNILKWVAIIVLPALNGLWDELAAAWGFPYEVQISKTISAVAVFLGAILVVSTVQYYNGNIEGETEETEEIDGE